MERKRIPVHFFFNDPSRRIITSDRIPASDQLSVISSWLVDQISSARSHTRAYTRELLMSIPAVLVLTNYTYRFISLGEWELRLHFFFYKNRMIYGDITRGNFVHTENGRLRNC